MTSHYKLTLYTEYGGDEFIVLLEDGEKEKLHKKLVDLSRQYKHPFHYTFHTFHPDHIYYKSLIHMLDNNINFGELKDKKIINHLQE